jgi:hypothetical protein
MYVAGHSEEIRLPVDEDRGITAPKQGAIATVPPVKPLRIDPSEVPHDP